MKLMNLIKFAPLLILVGCSSFDKNEVSKICTSLAFLGFDKVRATGEYIPYHECRDSAYKCILESTQDNLNKTLDYCLESKLIDKNQYELLVNKVMSE